MSLSTASLYLDLGQRLRAFIAASVRDEYAVEDIYQEIFIKIHLNLAAVRNEERIVPWIFQIARNTVADYFHSRKNEAMLPADLPSDERHRHDAVSVNTAEQAMKIIIDLLPERYRTAVLLYELDGLPQKKIAEKLGLSLSGAKSRVRRGRRLLRDTLSGFCRFEFDRDGSIAGYAKRNRDACPFEEHGIFLE